MTYRDFFNGLEQQIDQHLGVSGSRVVHEKLYAGHQTAEGMRSSVTDSSSTPRGVDDFLLMREFVWQEAANTPTELNERFTLKSIRLAADNRVVEEIVVKLDPIMTKEHWPRVMALLEQQCRHEMLQDQGFRRRLELGFYYQHRLHSESGDLIGEFTLSPDDLAKEPPGPAKVETLIERWSRLLAEPSSRPRPDEDGQGQHAAESGAD